MKTRWILVLLGLSLLGGCGQKGPLYLPDSAPANVANTTTQ